MWALFDSIWSDSDNGYVDLPGGRLDKPWLYNPDLSSAAAVDGLIALTNLESTISASTRQAIIDHLDAPEIDWWMRRDALLLLLSAPDLHVA
jgi:hypothetical protein